jgi:hypothetical protein
MANTYDLGDKVRVTGTFTDPLNSDAAIDPTAVKCSVRSPSEVVTTYIYGTDVAVKKASTGVYYLDLSLDTAGRWYYRWWSTGTGAAADEQAMIVKRHVAVE